MKQWFKDIEDSKEGTRFGSAEVLAQLNFTDQGLIPVIAQDHESGEVLMFAWMNQDALKETLETGKMCYWSRSRKTLWRKGESSGHQQGLVEMRADCDGDVLLARITQKGAACHTFRRSCFYLKFEGDEVVISSDAERG